jgi:hypothetical protein
MGSSIESANAAQVSIHNHLRLSARAQPSGESHHRPHEHHRGHDHGDKVTIRDSLSGSANLDLDVQGDEQRQPEERVTSTNLEYQRREATVLRLRTQEGDVVKLKLRSVETATVGVGEQIDGDTVVSNLELNTSSRTRLVLSVRGDINDAELAAIQSVAEQASQLAGNFFNGNLTDAFQAASDFAIDGEQLAKVSLRLSVRERLNFAQTVLTQNPVATLPATETSDEAAPPSPQVTSVVPKPVSGSTAPAVTRTDVPLPAAPVTTSSTTATDEPSPPAPTDEPTGPTNLLDAFQALADFLNAIGDFLESLLGSLNQPEEADTSEASSEDTGGSSAFSFRFKLDLFAAVLISGLEQSAEPEEPTDGEQLLTDTLAAVAQEVDPQSVSDLA